MRRRVKEAFLVNPPRRRRRSTGAPRKGSATAKRRMARVRAAKGGATRKRRGARKLGAGFTRARRHIVRAYGSKRARVWRRSPRSKSRRAGIRINPPMVIAGNPVRRRRRYGKRRAVTHYRTRYINAPRRYRRHRRNPAMTLAGPFDVMKNMPTLLTMGASIVATQVVPGLAAKQFPIIATNQWAKYGVQAATAIGGGMLVAKMVGKEHGKVWAAAGLASIVAEVIVTTILPMTGLTLSGYELDDYAVSGEEEGEVGAFPDYNQGVGAFPVYENAQSW